MSKSLQERLEDMTKPEMINYGRLTFGLEINSKMNKGDIEQAILSASKKFGGNNEIKINAEGALPPEHTKIKINTTELNKTGRPVIVGVNGIFYSLPVGVEITVPNKLVEVLNNAVRYEYEPNPEDSTELIRRDVHSYPFTTIATA